MSTNEGLQVTSIGTSTCALHSTLMCLEQNFNASHLLAR